MLSKFTRQIPDLLLTFCVFFLATASAFFHVVWLSSGIVVMECVAWFILAAFSLWLLARRDLVIPFLMGLRRNWFIFPFLIFAGISIFWSVDWEVSLYRWLVLIFTIIAAGYIGLRYDLQEIMRLLSVFGVYILFLSSVFVFITPDVGVVHYHSIQGAWRGIYWQKNHMGLMTAFFTILFLTNIIRTWRSGGKKVIPWAVLYLYSLFFLFQTDSAAAYLTVIFLHGAILLALLVLNYREKIQKWHYLVFIAAVILASIILYLNIDRFLGLFNRNATLTGRIPMWSYLFETYLSKRPFAGYGFNAFWYIELYRVAIGKAANYPEQIVIADNGFIDILINTGYMGLTLFLLFYAGTWVRSIAMTRAAKDILGVFPVILMAFTLLANISWSLLFESEGFFMLVMLALLFSISRSAADSMNIPL